MQQRLGLDLEIEPEFGSWLAGFTDGEGFFGFRVREGNTVSASFRIGLRDDDLPILEMIKDKLQVGNVYAWDPSGSRGGERPRAVYEVWALGDLYHVIIPLFEKFPLRSNKRHDFDIWKGAVGIAYNTKRQGWRKKKLDRLKELALQLRAIRQYKPPPGG